MPLNDEVIVRSVVDNPDYATNVTLKDWLNELAAWLKASGLCDDETQARLKVYCGMTAEMIGYLWRPVLSNTRSPELLARALQEAILHGDIAFGEKNGLAFYTEASSLFNIHLRECNEFVVSVFVSSYLEEFARSCVCDVAGKECADAFAWWVGRATAALTGLMRAGYGQTLDAAALLPQLAGSYCANRYTLAIANDFWFRLQSA